jgi:hypothetical protein
MREQQSVRPAAPATIRFIPDLEVRGPAPAASKALRETSVSRHLRRNLPTSR